MPATLKLTPELLDHRKDMFAENETTGPKQE